MQYRPSKAVMTEEKLRKAYNELTEKTYGFTFEDWYQNGYWSESNMPYTLFDGEKAIANVSINKMEILLHGKIHHYLQIGTVMTDEAYRNQGLSRYLMEEIKRDWENQCDGIFLFANDTVLDFYPKFGFAKEKQYHFTKEIQGSLTGGCRKLDMDSAEDRRFLKSYYEKRNPYSDLQVLHNFNLLMFYCGSFMKDCVCYNEKYDAVIIAEQDGEIYRCYDIYCDGKRELMEILESAAAPCTKMLSLEFTPKDRSGFKVSLREVEDDTLFVLESGGNFFKGEQLRFPEISHT